MAGEPKLPLLGSTGSVPQEPFLKAKSAPGDAGLLCPVQLIPSGTPPPGARIDPFVRGDFWQTSKVPKPLWLIANSSLFSRPYEPFLLIAKRSQVNSL